MLGFARTLADDRTPGRGRASAADGDRRGRDSRGGVGAIARRPGPPARPGAGRGAGRGRAGRWRDAGRRDAGGGGTRRLGRGRARGRAGPRRGATGGRAAGGGKRLAAETPALAEATLRV